MRQRAAFTFAGVFAAFSATVLCASSARATVVLRVELEPVRAQVGEAVSVRYSVSLRDQGAVQIMPLNFGNLQLLSDPSPPQVPMMWGTGFGFSMETSTEYIVRASRPGRYTITSGRAVDPRTGRVIAQAAPVTLIVGEAPPTSDGDGGVTAGDPNADPDASVAPQDPDAPPNGDMSGAYYDMIGFFRVGVDRPRAYLGEQLTYRVWVYSASPDAGCELTDEPTFPGFWNEAAFTPSRECARRWFSQQVNGRFMAVGLVRKYGLFATQTGRQRVGSVAGSVEVMSGGVFRQVRRAESRTPQAEVEVIEPPAQGRPEGYVPGTIGPVTLEASADRTQCPSGETVTISVRARSEGSLSSAQLRFERNVDGARVRASEGRTETGPGPNGRFESVRTMEILVVPERPGLVALGEATVPYWDPATEQYGVARVALPVIRATGERVARDGQGAAQEDPARALRGLSASPRLKAYSPLFSRVSMALGAALLPSLAAVGVAAARAAGRWRKRANEARASAEKNDPESLIAAAKRALEASPAEACALAARAIAKAKETLAESEATASDEANERVRAANEALEAVRFAGEGSAKSAVELSERAVRALLEALK